MLQTPLKSTIGEIVRLTQTGLNNFHKMKSHVLTLLNFIHCVTAMGFEPTNI